jgi:hypothetical protein
MDSLTCINCGDIFYWNYRGARPKYCKKTACQSAKYEKAKARNRLWQREHHDQAHVHQQNFASRRKMKGTKIDTRQFEEFMRWKAQTRGELSSGSSLSFIASLDEIREENKTNEIIFTFAGKEFRITPSGALALGKELIARARRLIPNGEEK